MGIYFNPEPSQCTELPDMDTVRLLQRQLLAVDNEREKGFPALDIYDPEAVRSLRLFTEQASVSTLRRLALAR